MAEFWWVPKLQSKEIRECIGFFDMLQKGDKMLTKIVTGDKT